MRAWVLGFALAVAGCATGPVYDQMTAAQIGAAVTVRGDKLDGYREADSNATRGAYPPLGNPKSDIWFRAIRFDSGRSAVQVVLWTKDDRDFMRPYQLNFGAPLRQVELKRADVDAHCESWGCIHTDMAYADLSDADVAWILASASNLFDVRIKTRLGDVDRRLRVDELRAVMAAVGLP